MNQKQIALYLPAEPGNDWLAAIDAERGDVPRIEFIREILRKSGKLKSYNLKQPTKRGKWVRK